jgi:dipeptide/tripeptide permease
VDKPRSFSIIRMVYHVSIHNVNWRNDWIGTRPKGRSLSDHPLSWAWCFDLDGYLGLYTGLGLVIAGVGLKPNISTMVGGLYRKVIFDAIKV